MEDSKNVEEEYCQEKEGILRKVVAGKVVHTWQKIREYIGRA